MIRISREAAALWPLLAAVTFAAPAFSQAPTEAQRDAIRSECRSDYEAHCSSVPPGGAASLQCLQKNMSSLAPGCQSAVRAVEVPAEPKAESKPETAPAATAATPSPGAAPATAPAALALRPMRPREVLFVLRSACGGDVRALCPGVEPGGGRIIECLATQAASLSPACQGVLAPFAAR